jgi:hypothetical protein
VKDPLAAFAAWEGQKLGPEIDGPPGFTGEFRAPSAHLHYAGAWVTSTAMTQAGVLVPAVYLKTVAGVLGTGPRYHVVEGIVVAEIAEDWGRAMVAAAERSRLDVATERR